MDEARRRKDAGNSDRDYGCHQPRCQRQPSGPLTKQPELEFIARQQKEEPKSYVGYQLDALWLGLAQNLRPN